MRFTLQFALFVLLAFTTGRVVAQPPCPPSFLQVSNDTAICPQQCATLKVLSSSSTIKDFFPTYVGSSIPYSPYPFVGTNIVSIPIDDQYASTTTPLPFTFCWWGVGQNNCVVGSNGQVSFTTSLAGGIGNCPWQINGPIPAANATAANATLNAIMGGWYDMYPFNGGTISYAVYGTAPCRAFVVSWSQIPMFSCTNLTGTQQIVMYESSNIIDIYIQSKPTCAWNGNQVIVGIQNAAGTVQYTAPGYNPFVGTITNFAYRFTPDQNPASVPSVAYSWTTVSGTPVGNGAQVTVCPPVTTTYVCKAHFTTGCSSSDVYDTVTVTIGSGLGSAFSFTESKSCTADLFTFINSTPPPIDTTWWNFGDGSPVLVLTGANALNSTTHSYTTGGPHTVKMVSRHLQCIDTLTHTINVSFGTLVADFTDTVHINCLGDTATFHNLSTITPGSIDSCWWSFGDGATMYVAGGNPTADVTHVYTTPGTFTVKLAGIKGFCHDTISKTVNVTFGTQVADFSHEIHLGCSGDSAIFTNLSTINPGVIGSSLWDFGDGNSQTLSGSNSVNSITHVYNAASTYNVTLTTTTGFCTNSVTYPVNIVHNPVVASFTVDKDSICRGTTVVFTNTSTGDGITAQWSFGDNAFSNQFSPIHTFLKSDQFITKLTVTDSVGCIKVATHNFTVLHITVHAPFPDTAVCLKDSLTLVPNLESQSFFNNFTYAWSPADNLGRTDLPTVNFFSNRDSTFQYVVTVTAASPFGCITDDTFYVHSRAPITITTCEDQDIEYGKSVRLHAHGAYYYFWQPVNFLDNPNMRDPVASPEATTKYTVIGYSETGCSDSAHVNVHVRYPSHYVCSAFSPNGDGKNDKFRIINMHFQKLLEFRVFNRWGEEVFNTLDPTDGWDGTWNGQPCDIGNYHYMVKIVSPDGELITDIGDITLVR